MDNFEIGKIYISAIIRDIWNLLTAYDARKQGKNERERN